MLALLASRCVEACNGVVTVFLWVLVWELGEFWVLLQFKQNM